ncbi:hypothetical protein FOL47_005825 [Perkinsus chesapeaki]|uniref:subtilisin n=1 Tax=Perkinsus chesapeaki TaxID=330153 RepID=A0A7J6LVG7_PERCH|nr:hypothetical protein FOL47_005825 [Perkinsus chesapeaki]
MLIECNHRLPRIANHNNWATLDLCSKHVILYTSVQEEPFEDAAVAALQSASKAGIPFICSSGNDGLDISKPGNQRYPCEYAKTIDGVICVAATVIKEMELLEISNYAPYINAAAPGYAFSTDLNGKYVARAGASCSAAMVAGVVTMMKSVSKEPLSVQAINSIIKETSTPGIERKGVQMDFGRLDALAAVKRVLG